MKKITLPYEWTPRFYQMNAWQHFQGLEDGKRGVCVWHRRAGKDLMGINVVAQKHMERVGLYWHLLPTYKQGRAIVWNGFTRDGRRFLDYFPGELLDGKNSTEMRVNFKNGSIYQVVGTDDINSLVGTNPIGCIFSEYSLHDPAAWNYLRPILRENGGWALFIFTARGRNHGYRLLNMAQKNPKWFSEVLVAGDDGTRKEDGTPVISDAEIKEERDSGMPPELIEQEFFCSFDAPMVGAYYGHQMMLAEKQKRISRVPWEPRLNVDTFWDLGVGDSTAIWFVQSVGMEHRVIDYYEASGEGLSHYANVLRGQREGHEDKAEYVYGRHSAPWDIEIRELSSGRSRLEIARSLGIRFRVIPQHSVKDGIEAVRNIMPQCWFDEIKCERGIEALRQYRKEWDDKRRDFKDNPLHDWTSHGADAFRTFAWGHKSHTQRRRKPVQRTTVDEYDYTR